jgi:hypothetical protein
MKTGQHLAQHDSQISRLEQVMTALAEAQVRTEDETSELRRSVSKLNRSMAALADAQAQTERRWQAYLTTLPKN